MEEHCMVLPHTLCFQLIAVVCVSSWWDPVKQCLGRLFCWSWIIDMTCTLTANKSSVYPCWRGTIYHIQSNFSCASHKGAMILINFLLKIFFFLIWLSTSFIFFSCSLKRIKYFLVLFCIIHNFDVVLDRDASGEFLSSDFHVLYLL